MAEAFRLRPTWSPHCWGSTTVRVARMRIGTYWHVWCDARVWLRVRPDNALMCARLVYNTSCIGHGRGRGQGWHIQGACARTGMRRSDRVFSIPHTADRRNCMYDGTCVRSVRCERLIICVDIGHDNAGLKTPPDSPIATLVAFPSAH